MTTHNAPSLATRLKTWWAALPLDRLATAFLLFALLYMLYLVTYSGVFNSDDERYIFDTIESMVERGTFFLTQTTHLQGFRTSGVEPSQPFLAAPLYLIADQFDQLGSVQTVFLFNPLVTALTAAVLYLFALDKGYSHRVALTGSLLFGTGTIVWPYSKTFFREPLTTLTLFASAYFFHRWYTAWQQSAKAGEPSRLLWFLVAAATFSIAFFAKEAALIAAPVLILYAIPPGSTPRQTRRGLLTLALLVLGVALLLAASILLFKTVFIQTIISRYRIANRLLSFWRGLSGSGEGLAGFLVSPGKSLFVFSPITILLIPALFVRNPARRRERWLAVGLLVSFVVVYAAVRGDLWHGGSGWGPRYMVPLTPFLVMGSLPALEWIFQSGRRWPKIGLGLLSLLSVLVQWPGLLINIHDYYHELDLVGEVGAPWKDAVWQIKYSQILGHLRLAPDRPFDIAWLRPDLDRLALAALLLGLLVFAGLLFRSKDMSRRAAQWTLASSMALLLALTSFALRRAYDDPVYGGDNVALQELRAYITATASSTEPIILSNPHYVEFFANYYKGDSDWYTLPRSPGERHSPEEIPLIESDNPWDLVSQEAADLFAFVTRHAQGKSIWLVVDGGPFTPWNPRPPEWWAAEHYYTVQMQEFDPTVRVVEYLPFRAPHKDPLAHTANAQFGSAIALEKYQLDGDERPDAITYHPGDGLGVALEWHALAAPEKDYIVAAFVMDNAGNVILQQDRPPDATFRPTSGWQTNDIIRDYFGFHLPPNLPPGEYDIWVAMYSWPLQERLPISSPTQTEPRDLWFLTSFEIVPVEQTLE